MKKLALILALIVGASSVVLAADAANDALLMQRNSANDDNVQRNVTATANSLFAFDGSLIPTATAAPILASVQANASGGLLLKNFSGTTVMNVGPGSGTGVAFNASGLTSVNSVTAPASTDLTLTGGSTGASLVLGHTAGASMSSASKLNLTNSEASVGSTSGALRVTGGIYAGAASVFSATLTANGSPATGAVSIKQTEGGVGLYLQRGTNSGGGTGFLIKALDATPGGTVFSVGTSGQTVMGALTINAGSPSGVALLTGGDSTTANNVYSAYSFDNYYTTGSAGSMMQVRGKTDASASRFTSLEVCPTINQGTTNGFSILRVSPYLAATGSGTKLLLDLGTNSAANGSGTHTSLVSVDSTGAATFAGAVTAASLATPQTPSTAVSVVSTHKVAIVLNGTTYYILLTNVP